MTLICLVRMAWAGAIAAAASGFLYLAFAPIPGSRATDTLLTIGVAFLGAVMGAALENGLENSINYRQSRAEIIRLPTDAQPLEKLSARGA